MRGAPLQRTYSGLLDDVMIRYSDEFLSGDFFNRMIAKNLLFAGGIYFNDGYLVNHPVARRSLFNEEGLLRRMLATGFIRILTRSREGRDLAEMPEKMAQQGNESYAELVRSAEWADLKPLLERIGSAAAFTNTLRPWPAYDMSFSFTKLMSRVFTAAPEELGLSRISSDDFLRIRDGFLERQPHLSGPRDKLERAAKAVLAEQSGDVRSAMNEIMTIGNQAYHYNFGVTLTSEDPEGVAVDTTVGAAFEDLLKTREISEGQLDDVPIMRLPRDFPVDHGDLFISFLDPSTRVGAAKQEYIGALRTVIESDLRDIEFAKASVRDASQLYTDRIVELLAPRFGRLSFESESQSDDSFAVAFVKTTSATERGGPGAASSAGLAISVRGDANERGRQFLIEKFRLRDSTDHDHSSEDIVRFGEIRQQIASLAFDSHAAADFIADVPPAPTF
jgi:hypothetical protein